MNTRKTFAAAGLLLLLAALPALLVAKEAAVTLEITGMT